MNAQLLRAWFVMLLVVVMPAVAAEPEIRNVDLRGLTIGTTTTVTVDGTNLSPESRLVLPFAATQEIKSGATATRAVFDVTVPADVTPGVYNLRIVSADGVSSPIVVGVDALPQLPTSAEITALPVAIHGAVSGSNVVAVRFPGKAGEDITIEVEAARLGSKLRPVLHLFDARRQQLGWSWSSPRWHGDARLLATLPADGVYTVTLHDLEYASPAPNHFRLKLGRWESVDQVFPPVVSADDTAPLELLGSVATTSATLPTTPATGNSIVIPWPDSAKATGLRPWVSRSSLPHVLEQPAGETPQNLGTAPAAVSGRLSAADETDRYQLGVTPGQKLRFELTAERLGSRLDGVVVLLNDQGGQLAQGDDSSDSSDPVLEYTVPANVTSLIVAVSDALKRGGPDSIYRLVVRDVSTGHSGQGVRLLAQNDRVSLLPGVRNVLPVLVERNGYDGAVQLTIEGLPDNVSVEGAEIPAASEGTLLTLTVPAANPPEPTTDTAAEPVPASAALVTLLGVQGTVDGSQSVQLASFEAHPLSQLQPWLSSELALAVSASPAASPPTFQIDWNSVPDDASLVLAGKLALPIKLIRPAGDPTPVRLSVVTSQNIPQVNGRPDMNKALRAEAAVEIAADKVDGQLVVLVPRELPQDIYDLTLKAELLTANKQQVVATAFAPVKRLNVLNPVGLTLASSKLETTIDPKAGATLGIAGQIERRAGMAGPVTVTLTGLPAGVSAPNVVVKPEDDAFELTVKFPANFQPAELSGLELTGSGPPNPAQAGVVVKSKPVLININVLPTAKSEGSK